MKVRAKSGKGPLLFEWDSDTRTIELVRKDMDYNLQLDDNANCIREECSKDEWKRRGTYKSNNLKMS